MTRRARWLLLIAVALIPFVLVAHNAHEQALHELHALRGTLTVIPTDDVEDVTAHTVTKFKFVPLLPFGTPHDPRTCPWGHQEQGCEMTT